MPSSVKMAAVPNKSLAQLTLLKPKAIGIAASTGGPEAIGTIMRELNGTIPHMPIAITQHIGGDFLKSYVGQVQKASGISAHLADNNMPVKAGNIYIANANSHMVFVKKSILDISLTLDDGPEECHCKPSANPMLRSMAKAYGEDLLTIVLTGMGNDGEDGARVTQEYGGTVVAQDKESSSVWGMPKAVYDNGLANACLPLLDISQLVRRICAS